MAVAVLFLGLHGRGKGLIPRALGFSTCFDLPRKATEEHGALARGNFGDDTRKNGGIGSEAGRQRVTCHGRPRTDTEWSDRSVGNDAAEGVRFQRVNGEHRITQGVRFFPWPSVAEKTE